MIRAFLFALIFTFPAVLIAQDYLNEGKKRLNFAKTYFELGSQYSPSFRATNPFINYKTSVMPYLNIGGLHFWGHADFYIGIPLGQINFSKNDSIDFTYNQSVATGFRYFPWVIKDKKIRPYIGTSWAIVNFKQASKVNSTQPLLTKSKIHGDLGLLYGKGNFFTRLGLNIHPYNQVNYPFEANNFQKIKLPNYSVYFGLVYAFESTKSKGLDKVNEEINKYPKLSSPNENATKTGDWFVGFGPSTSFIVAKTGYNETTFPFFNKRPISNTFFDFGIGYHFNKLGIITAFAYRSPTFTNNGFDVSQSIKKSSKTLEIFKFLTDYSGFTPYLGINIGLDKIRYTETVSGKTFIQNVKLMNPGFTFGWDILPGKTEQPFVLRTNLRWYPFEKINVNKKVFKLNQIEYNVIQLVYYPARSKRLKSKYRL